MRLYDVGKDHEESMLNLSAPIIILNSCLAVKCKEFNSSFADDLFEEEHYGEANCDNEDIEGTCTCSYLPHYWVAWCDLLQFITSLT